MLGFLIKTTIFAAQKLSVFRLILAKKYKQ